MSKIFDGKIHAMSEQWAYVGYEYEKESPASALIADTFILIRAFKQYIDDLKYEGELSEFSLVKYPPLENEFVNKKPFMIIKFKRLPGDGLDE